MKAANRVNSPSVISVPATSSITPAATISGGSGPGSGNGTGKAKNLDVACSKNSRPAMILKTDSIRGDQAIRLGMLARSSWKHPDEHTVFQHVMVIKRRERVHGRDDDDPPGDPVVNLKDLVAKRAREGCPRAGDRQPEEAQWLAPRPL